MFLGWQYRYYCPIPGCSHHILKCLKEDINGVIKENVQKENEKVTLDDEKKSEQKTKSGHFTNITSLKQHYSKVVAL